MLAAVSRVDQLAQQHLGGTGPKDQRAFADHGREREGPKLNYARKAEFADLTDNMSKASFVLWRDIFEL